MTDVNESNLLGGGNYARKQLFSKDRIVSWSHRSRFKMARWLVQPYAGRRLLDYGCGDGTFLALVHDLFPNGTGADVDPNQTADCVKRFERFSGLSFVLTQDLKASAHTAPYDVLICMEVLEHCTDDNVSTVLSDLSRLSAPGAVVIISVPIEIGPTLILKQMARTIAGWRNVGDYKHNERYSWGELLKMTFADEHTEIPRLAYTSQWTPEHSIVGHGHKGFNWRRLRSIVARKFDLQQTHFTPLGWLGGFVSSQVWFVCTVKSVSD